MKLLKLTNSYHAATDALINQHGFNLLRIGLITLVCGVIIWRNKSLHLLALASAAVVGGLADVGYFIFMDLGGFINFMPGTVMTIFSGSAILLSIWVWRACRGLKTNKYISRKLTVPLKYRPSALGTKQKSKLSLKSAHKIERMRPIYLCEPLFILRGNNESFLFFRFTRREFYQSRQALITLHSIAVCSFNSS